VHEAGGRVTITSGTGTCVVRYDQAGDATYAAAPPLVESVTAQKADQSTQSFAVVRARCTVPRLVGKRLNAAKRALVASRCRVGDVRYAHTSAAKRGRIVAQGKRAGRVLRAGSKVDLVVGRR
jgi:ribosomal protein S11